MYGVNGLSSVPTTAKEAAGRNANQKLEEKLLTIRNGRRDMGRNRHHISFGPSQTTLNLASDVVLNLVFAAGEGRLNQAARHLFEKLTRAEILCWMLQEVAYAYRLNKDRFGYKEEKNRRSSVDRSESDVLLRNIFRLTREEVTEKYGAEDWHSRYRPYERVYESDVEYGQFLRDHGLGYRYGGNITEADLPPIDVSALFGHDVFAKATAMRRLAREHQKKTGS